MERESYQRAKLTMLSFFFVSILLVLAACSGGNKQSSTEGDEIDENKVFHLRMNTINPPAAGGPPTPSTIATDIFAEEVREKTNGRVDIEVFYSNQLAGQSESLDALARGTIDLQVITPAAWSDKIPEGNFASLPFAWKSEEELSHLLRETEFGKLYEEALLNYGVKPLHYHYTGSAGYLSNTPITNTGDMKGLVVNAVGTLKGNFYSEMGAGISSVPFADYYEGLLRGTFDAVSFPYYALEVMNLGEVVDYITIPGEVDPSLSLIVISQSTWDKLPSDLQEIIWETAMDIEQRTIKASQEYSARGFEYAKEIGVEIVEMTDEGYNEFVETAKKTYWKGFAETNERTKKMIEVLEANKE